MDIDKSWLAGFIDADGTVIVERNFSRGNTLYSPVICVYNTNRNGIDRANEIMKKLGAKPVLREDRRGDWVGASFQLRVRGRHVLGVAEAIAPYMTVKKKQAELLAEFINIRVAAGKKYPYGDREKEIYEQVKNLNANRRKRSPHPIDNIEWIPAKELNPNDYNPNIVFTPELKLLEQSIIDTKWIQPILITKEKVIIDGFHRYSLCLNSDKVKAMTDGKVPCAVLNLSEPERMLLTIRINRAKGSHQSIKMHEIVHKLVEFYGITKEKVAKDIGATKAEVELLLQDGVFKKLGIPNHKYSKAWYPK